jgi:2-hydroxy-3-keto-5-methylthiopentenyl-1-phosphate phosphatase
MKKKNDISKYTKVFPCKDAVICDFNGTISELDMCDEIIDNFETATWRSIGSKYAKGVISHKAMNKKFTASLKTSPQELAEFIAHKMKIRTGF